LKTSAVYPSTVADRYFSTSLYFVDFRSFTVAIVLLSLVVCAYVCRDDAVDNSMANCGSTPVVLSSPQNTAAAQSRFNATGFSNPFLEVCIQ
jgi:hypothetical protein